MKGIIDFISFRLLMFFNGYLNKSSDAKIGRSLAKALCDYYRHIGVIPPKVGVSSKKTDKRGRHRHRRPTTGRAERCPF